ncbi:hypothetical protein DL770_005166 [Monosporascus sp. CRB-9-2]|nr:hypothetical protein DL770_005166 [Monosporascus sp. CRB-9-2]
MKFTTLTALVTLAVAATAAPTEVEVRTESCTNEQKSVCCNGILNCVVQVIAPSCSGSAYCCKTDAPDGALINLDLLNCVKIG